MESELGLITAQAILDEALKISCDANYSARDRNGTAIEVLQREACPVKILVLPVDDCPDSAKLRDVAQDAPTALWN
jgi:hypothetical protein